MIFPVLVSREPKYCHNVFKDTGQSWKSFFHVFVPTFSQSWSGLKMCVNYKKTCPVKCTENLRETRIPWPNCIKIQRGHLKSLGIRADIWKQIGLFNVFNAQYKKVHEKIIFQLLNILIHFSIIIVSGGWGKAIGLCRLQSHSRTYIQ